jgi:DNA polymerase-1
MEQLQHPLFLIFDGMSQAYRAHFAIRDLSNSQGLPTNAVYGFALMLKRVLQKYPPDYVAIALDGPAETVRKQQYAPYKATRKKMPDDLAQQIPYIKRLCSAMQIPILEIPGQEADDIIATVAKQAVARGFFPVVVTLDKDLYQIIDTILVLNTSKDDMIVDRDKVKELFGVSPEQIPDLLGLWGDASDNVPGAPGIGEKTARDLIQRFGSIEACLERANEVQSPRQRASLMDNREQILMSKQLVTIDSAVPITVDWSELAVKPPDRTALLPLLRELEFSALVKDYVPESPEQIVEVLQTNALPAIGDQVFFDVQGDHIALWSGTGSVANLPLDTGVAELLSNPKIRKVTWDLKSAIHGLKQRGLDIVPPYDDPMLMSFLLMPNRGKYELPDLVFEVFGQTIDSKPIPDWSVWTKKLFDHFQTAVESEVAQAYHEIELPLTPVLAGMERDGIRIDAAAFQKMSVEMGAQIESLTASIYEAAGMEFNINSTRQLGEVLFEKLNLPHSKKLKKSGQYSTAVEVLEELAIDYELPRLVLEYRQFSKFKSTYVDVIPTLVDANTGRLHTTFNQAGAATGRLSSNNPNLQNIPVRTELGRSIRGAFVPEPGWCFVAADYSQVELRIVAHLSGDARLAEAFHGGEDVHRRTAAEVLGIPMDQVTPVQRNSAKAVNFGIVYGQTAYGLAQQLGISNEEASQFISRYFERYQGVQRYIESSLSTARDTGMTRTLFGRLRQHPEINSRNGMRRSMAERTAINSPIQGTAADIIKLAMIHIADELKRTKLRTRMVLQVHDELIFEVPEDELHVRSLIVEKMQNVVKLSVPLTVDVKQGLSWNSLVP